VPSPSAQPRVKTALVVARALAERAALLQPGDMLPAEHLLVEELGVARSTVREALRILELLGVVMVKAGRRGGPVVLRAEPETLARTLSMALQLADVTFEEVLRARKVVEIAGAREAATLRTPEQIAELDAILEGAEATVDEMLWLKQNTAFHRAIAAAAENTVLAVFHASLKAINDGQLAAVSYSIQRRTYINRLHREIFDGIASGDPDAAGDAMGRHMDDFVRWLRRQDKTLLRAPVKWQLTFD
jgi:DNA-binding FadR family transcriptional regulator